MKQKNTNANIQIPEKLSKALSILMMAILPVGLFFIVEFGYNYLLAFWSRMSITALAVNYAWFAMLVIGVYCLFSHPRVALTALTLLTLLYATANHFVTELKGMPITISDLRAVRTAVAVMGDYDYVPDLLLFKSIMVAAWLVFGIILFIRRPESMSNRGRNIKRLVGVGLLVCLVILSMNMNHFLSETFESELDMGDMRYAYEINGYIPVTLSGLSTIKVEAPEGYSAEKVREILTPYDKGDQPKETEHPMIICIMNEAFSDLSVLGPIKNQKKILDYVYSLKDDPNTVAWGSCLVSIRGTGTANTEFEFLVGDSLRFYGGGCPYNDCSMRGVPNLASKLKAKGYHTIAMHPEAATNWRRNGVYPEFGFDEFLSYKDYIGYETISNEADDVLNSDDNNKAGGRISDLGDYKKLIDVLEEQKGPAFLFNVTMQNHSGYSKLDKRIADNLVDSDTIINADKEAATYETLIAISDDALEYLIEYLRDYDKPVIVALFGDHQPDLSDTVEGGLMSRNPEKSSLAKDETKYMTQYFIWSNYDTGFKYSSSDVISANYIASIMRKATGCELTAFENYLLAQMNSIPAMNRSGYLGDDAKWHSYDEDNQYTDWVKKYEMIQYNNMFDVEENVDLFHTTE